MSLLTFFDCRDLRSLKEPLKNTTWKKAVKELFIVCCVWPNFDEVLTRNEAFCTGDERCVAGLGWFEYLRTTGESDIP